MKILKFIVVLLTVFACSVFVYGYLNELEIFGTLHNFYDRTPSSLYENEYTKDIDIDFVKLTDDFEANDRQELLNIYYTIISSGMDEFVFYCSNKYTNCIENVISINNDSELLSQMNNFVNVYNSFRSIKTTYTTNGKITLSISKIYSNEDINLINSKLDDIEKIIYKDSFSEYDKILAIHDYIVNTTKYNLKDENKIGTPSSTAIGVLVNNLATCNGYTDTAALLLDRLNIPNVRISSENHIWNLVYTNGKWLHMDLTWDDPVNSLNKDMLTHDYFLKTTEEFDEIGKLNPKNEHKFNREIYNFINN